MTSGDARGARKKDNQPVIDIDPAKRNEQRKFGLVMAAALILLGLIRWGLKGAGHMPIGLFATAGAFLVLGLVAPRSLKPVLIGWLKFAFMMNWLVTRILLTIAWVFLITPSRVIMRCFMGDPLKRKWAPDAETYWEDAEEQPAEFERYTQQF